jgi:hypothetical protein
MLPPSSGSVSHSRHILRHGTAIFHISFLVTGGAFTNSLCTYQQCSGLESCSGHAVIRSVISQAKYLIPHDNVATSWTTGGSWISFLQGQTNSLLITVQIAFGFHSTDQWDISLNGENDRSTKLTTDNYLVTKLGISECVNAVKRKHS